MTVKVNAQHDSFPFSAVTYIEARFPDGVVAQGSGSVVGQNDVLTASHVVYDEAHGGVADTITVYPGRDGSDTPFGSYQAERLGYFDLGSYSDSLLTRDESEEDLALLGFDETFASETGAFQLDPNAGARGYNLSGYPSASRDTTGPRLTNDVGDADPNGFYSVLDFDGLQASGGNSGGPLWYAQDGTAYQAGVVSTTSWAADIAQEADTLQGWIDGNDDLFEPVTSPDFASTLVGTGLTLEPLRNDSDPNGDALQLTASGGAEHGTLARDATTLTYTPEPGFVGTETLSYTVTDNDGGTASGEIAVEVRDAQVTDVHRFFNTKAGGHFYTPDDQEAAAVDSKFDFMQPEGVGFWALDESEAIHPDAVDVFRFFNTQSGGHFYTADDQEAATVRQSLEMFEPEGVAFQAFDSQLPGTVPVYRFFNPQAGGHFYTADQQEAEKVRESLDQFQDEGVGFYAYPEDVSVDTVGVGDTGDSGGLG